MSVENPALGRSGLVVPSWVIGSFANDLMLRITPAVTAMTPVVLILILVVSFAYDIRPKPGVPDGGTPRLGASRS